MEPDEVRELYGEDYAKGYAALWQDNEEWYPETRNHLESIAPLVANGQRWLDVGCGTGYFLSKFPGVERAGTDLSPRMLEQARAANPDALFFREGDFRDDVPEWHDQWDVVTCTGQPWSYLQTMEEFHLLVENLARWTKPDGVCFVPLLDLADLTGMSTPYPPVNEPRVLGELVVTGVTWSSNDFGGGVHRNMLAPALGYWLELFSQHFQRVEVVRWPHEPTFLPVARRNVLATRKRGAGDDGPTEIIYHPIPEGSADTPQASEPDLSVAECDGEQASSVDPFDPSVADEAAVDRDDPNSSADVALASEPGPEGRLPGRSLYDQPLSYLIGRIRPWSPEFWRSVRRKAGRLR